MFLVLSLTIFDAMWWLKTIDDNTEWYVTMTDDDHDDNNDDDNGYDDDDDDDDGQEEYGAPAAPVVDSYGSPQAAPLNRSSS